MRTPTWIVAGFLALHLISAHWDPLCLWGVDMLAYLPLWAEVLFAVLGVALLVPEVRIRLLEGQAGLPRQLDPWHSRTSSLRFAALLAVLALAAFLCLPLLDRSRPDARGTRLLIGLVGVALVLLWVYAGFSRGLP